MSRKTTGTPVATRRRVAVGTALLTVTALVGTTFAAGATVDPEVTSAYVYTDGTVKGALVGPGKGGTSTIVMEGTDLDKVVGVWFGSRPAQYVTDSPTSLLVTPPARPKLYDGRIRFALAGEVTWDDVKDNETEEFYDYTDGPVVEEVTIGTDKTVTIKGQQFVGATAVLIGDVLTKINPKTGAPTLGTEFDTLKIKTPSVKGGSLDVSVISPNGVGTLPGAYGLVPVISKVTLGLAKTDKPVVTASAATGTVLINPSKADTATVNVYKNPATGTVVWVTGSNFSGLKSITFGKAAAAFTVVNDTALRVRIPAKDALDAFDSKTPNTLKVDVFAENAIGKSVKAFKFSYHTVPVVTSADDLVGTPNAATNTVVLKGSGLQQSKVTFGTKAGKVTASTDDSITVTVPKGTGTAAVKVDNKVGVFTLPVSYEYKTPDTTTPWPAK